MRIFQLSIITIFLCLASVKHIYSQTGTLVPELNSPTSITNFLSISYDSQTMIYASRLKTSSQYSFYLRENGANGWKQPTEIVEINNLLSPEAKIGGTSFNYNATVIYFSLDANDGNGMDIYFIERLNNQWSIPSKFDANINTTENESDPSISADGNSFYFTRSFIGENEFSSNFDCGVIFVSEKDKNGKWQKPYRLPSQINSGCESTPRICSDNKTLLFSSVKNNDLGFDIYVTKAVAKGIWSEPILVESISNEFSNIYPNLSFSGEEIYGVYQQKKNTKKEIDEVYKSNLAKGAQPNKTLLVKGKVADLYTDKPIAATIHIINPFTSKIISTYTSNSKTGEYSFFLESNTSYRIDYFGENYSHEIFNYSIETLDSNKIEEKNIKLYSSASLVMNIFDEEIFQPLDADIQVFDNETNQPITLKNEKLFAGRFKFNLPLGKEYKIISTMKNYVTDTLVFDIKKVVQFDEFEKDIELAVLKREFFFDVKDGQTDQYVNADIEIVNKNRNERIVISGGDAKSGKYKVMLREGDEYEINVLSSKGYAYYNSAVDLSKEESNKMEIGLLALNAATKLQLNNINFETNSAELTSFSFVELDRVVELITKNPNLKIEISAHTDNVGSDAYNLKLSERRAQSVVQYLTDKNVNPENLIAKGYGESTPLFPNDTDENKEKNRRVELSILEIQNADK